MRVTYMPEETDSNKIYNQFLQIFKLLFLLRGYCTPNLELACFVCYLKIVNTFMKNNACILE